MGTGMTGRYPSTRGSARKASDFSVIHSNEGTFKISQSGHKKTLRLKSGGHGQKNIELLKRYNIKYNIVHTYPNGVRIGNIPNHCNKLKREGTNQAWFPENWTEKDIKRAGEHVVGLRKNRNVSSGKIMYGRYHGVDVCVIRTKGIIGSIFPNSDQSIRKRRK